MSLGLFKDVKYIVFSINIIFTNDAICNLVYIIYRIPYPKDPASFHSSQPVGSLLVSDDALIPEYEEFHQSQGCSAWQYDIYTPLALRIMKASKTSLNCNKIGNLSMTLVLDKRTNKNTEKYPMAICFNIDRTRWYYKLVDMPFQTETFFNSVCSVSSSRSRLMDIHDQWQ